MNFRNFVTSLPARFSHIPVFSDSGRQAIIANAARSRHLSSSSYNRISRSRSSTLPALFFGMVALLVGWDSVVLQSYAGGRAYSIRRSR